MVLKFVKGLVQDRIESLQKELVMIRNDLEKYYPGMVDLSPFEELAINIRLLKIAILEAIIGERS